ncbi:MAG: hypothetical protein JXA33_19135, partial [Anaerolineae bacterium]|nr:hypothetical protein [Anaerolineae bacterium]
QSREDDYVNISLDRLWEIFGATTYSPLRDIKDVYDALVAANVGQTQGASHVCNLDDLDMLFVLHGVYYDMDNDRHYDCNEEVGRAADNYWHGHPTRRDAPLAEAYISVDFSGLGLTTPVTLTVDTAFTGASYLDFAYTVALTQAQNSLVYIEPPPAARIPATVTLGAYTGNRYSANNLVVSNDAYWQLVDAAPVTGSVVLTHTFEMVGPAPQILDVQPLTLTNDAPQTLSITLDEAQDGARVWLGYHRLAAVNCLSSTMLQATVPAGMTPGAYTVRVANPGTALATYAEMVQIVYPSDARNVMRITHGVGAPGDEVQVYVDADTQDAMTGIQLRVNFPADTLILMEPPVEAYRSQYLSSFDYSTPSLGSLILLWTGNSNEAIPSGQGTLAEFTFRIAENAVLDTAYPLAFDQAILSDNQGNALPVTAISGEVQVCTDCFAGVRAGDANGDGDINVLDYYRVLNIILGLSSPSSEEQYAADANGDGQINVLDLISIVLTILSGNGRGYTATPEVMALTNVESSVILTLPTVPAVHGDTVTLPLTLTNEMDVAGLEVHLAYSEALTLTDIVATQRTEHMRLDTMMGAPGIAGFVLSSLSGRTIPPGSGAAVTLIFETTPDTVLSPLCLTEAVAGDAQGQPLAVHWFDLVLSAGQEQEAQPGDSVYYAHTLTNQADTTDTVMLAAISSEGWSVNFVSPAYPGGTASLPVHLGIGQTTIFTLNVSVPTGIVANRVNTTTITATSLGDPAVSVSVFDVTVVKDVDVKEYIYLPIVLRNQS